MAQDVTLSMEGMLLNWLKEQGDTVSKGEVIAEFEADKATVEVEAPVDGVLTELRLDIGEEADEGTVIAVIGDAGEAPSGGDDTAAEPAQESANGAAAKSEAQPEAQTQAAPAASSNGAAARTPDGRIKISPLARNIAEEKGYDIAQIQGSGPGGRIVRADVEAFDPSQAAPASQAAPSGQGQPAAPAAAPSMAVDGISVVETWGKVPEEDVEVEDLSRMRKAIAKGTIRSFTATPHFYITVEMDVAPLLALRKELNADLEAEGIKISVNDMLVKAAALTLKQFPNFNSHYYGDKIVRHKRINVAIAVALPDNGLVNVVSPDADRTTLSEMAVYHKQMFSDARDGKIKREYIDGGTFLVSNLGAYGVESFSSIIDPPQSGALAIGASRQVPVVLDDGTLGVGTRMKVTLSVDHRVGDGASGAEWLQYFKRVVENPMRLLV